jgi:hypothetical protein
MNPKNVFINCPYDDHYFILLKPLLFTLIYIDLKPQISETSDSGEIRLHKIKSLMSESKYSIHDLSRMESVKSGDLPRFNMPFECGIDFGIKLTNPDKRTKKFLILEKEQFRYQKVISDISGNDIKAHKNDPEQVVKVIRDWFKPINPKIPRHKQIWLAYAEFEFDYEEILNSEGYDPKDIHALTFSDIIENMTIWIRDFKKQFNK